MYGLDLTRQIERQLSLTLHVQEKEARVGKWSEERWIEARALYDALAERFDIPGGYTDADNPFADCTKQIWRACITGVRTLRDNPFAAAGPQPQTEKSPLLRAEDALLGALVDTMLSYRDLIKIGIAAGINDEGARLAIGRLQSRGAIGFDVATAAYKLGHNFIPKPEAAAE